MQCGNRVQPVDGDHSRPSFNDRNIEERAVRLSDRQDSVKIQPGQGSDQRFCFFYCHRRKFPEAHTHGATPALYALRYPGHIEKMAILRDTGFFSKDPLEICGKMIRPIDFTAKLLFPKWKLNEGEADLTVMTVIVEGRKGKKRLRYTYDLFDKYDPATGIHSMARTTGYTATVALNMIADKIYTRKGMSVPEFIGRQPECVKYMLQGLKKRGVIYTEKTEEI